MSKSCRTRVESCRIVATRVVRGLAGTLCSSVIAIFGISTRTPIWILHPQGLEDDSAEVPRLHRRRLRSHFRGAEYSCTRHFNYLKAEFDLMYFNALYSATRNANLMVFVGLCWWAHWSKVFSARRLRPLLVRFGDFRVCVSFSILCHRGNV